MTTYCSTHISVYFHIYQSIIWVWNRVKLILLVHLIFGSFCVTSSFYCIFFLFVCLSKYPEHIAHLQCCSFVLHPVARNPKYTACLVHFLQLDLFKVKTLSHCNYTQVHLELDWDHLTQTVSAKKENAPSLDSNRLHTEYVLAAGFYKCLSNRKAWPGYINGKHGYTRKGVTQADIRSELKSLWVPNIFIIGVLACGWSNSVSHFHGSCL